jgi:hypothetical protein
LKSMKVNFNIFRGQHNHHILTSFNNSGEFQRLEWGTDSHLQHLQSELKIFFKMNGIKFCWRRFKTCMSPFQERLWQYWRQKVVQRHINTECVQYL